MTQLWNGCWLYHSSYSWKKVNFDIILGLKGERGDQGTNGVPGYPGKPGEPGRVWHIYCV